MSEQDSHPTQTDWEALQVMTDENIDYSDIPPLPDSFFRKARLRRPSKKGSHITQAQNDSGAEPN